jgi:hypothetical protein
MSAHNDDDKRRAGRNRDERPKPRPRARKRTAEQAPRTAPKARKASAARGQTSGSPSKREPKTRSRSDQRRSGSAAHPRAGNGPKRRPVRGRAASADRRAPSRKRPTIRRRRILKLVGIFTLVLALGLALAGGLVYASITRNLPDPEGKAAGRDQTSVVYDRNGEELAKLFAEQNRTDRPALGDPARTASGRDRDRGQRASTTTAASIPSASHERSGSTSEHARPPRAARRSPSSTSRTRSSRPSGPLSARSPRRSSPIAREALQQRPHPGALPQHHLLRARCLRCRVGGAGLLRQERHRSGSGRVGDDRRCHQVTWPLLPLPRTGGGGHHQPCNTCSCARWQIRVSSRRGSARRSHRLRTRTSPAWQRVIRHRAVLPGVHQGSTSSTSTVPTRCFAAASASRPRSIVKHAAFAAEAAIAEALDHEDDPSAALVAVDPATRARFSRWWEAVTSASSSTT